MFKLYHINKEERQEVFPINGVYIVKELGFYEFFYDNGPKGINDTHVFIEDLLLDRSYYEYNETQIVLKKSYRLFQDYFGFASLKINNELFKLNIQIEKLKLAEIEEILLYLWDKEEGLLDVFFSKSTVSAKSSSSGEQHSLTSKFLIFADSFFNKFNSLYLRFKNIPYSVLRRDVLLTDYEPRKVSSHTVNWLLENIDNVYFDSQVGKHPDLIRVGNNNGFIDKIETTINQETFSVYENEIILGAFQILLNKLSSLKKSIVMTVNIEHQYGNEQYADFRDMKKLPYIKLFQDSCSIESKLNRLNIKYKNIFKHTLPRLERPRITNVFSHKSHYREAYMLIKNAFDYKFDFDGELNLFNIKKLSELYEIYNLHQLIQGLKLKLNLDYFKIRKSTTRIDNIIDYQAFESNDCKVEMFYEPKYPCPNLKTHLIRIDCSVNGTYYCPDYLIQITTPAKTTLLILDSKYTKLYTIKSTYINDCMFKYILNTGIKGEPYMKIDDLVLLYPGELAEKIIESEVFSPQVKIIPSKPKYENHLDEYLSYVIEKYLPATLYKKEISGY